MAATQYRPLQLQVGRWETGDGRWHIGAGGRQVRTHLTLPGTRAARCIALPHHRMGQDGLGCLVPATPPKKETGGCREGWRSLSLSPSLSSPTYLPHSHFAAPKPSSPNPSILSPQPHPASFPRFKLNHHYQHPTSNPPRGPPPVSAWETSRELTGYLSLPPPSQPSPRYPQRPPVFVFRTVSRHTPPVTPSVPPTRCLPTAQ